eukprot:scaffold104377_cov50-Phaeocystis_antarctica.AAC.1
MLPAADVDVAADAHEQLAAEVDRRAQRGDAWQPEGRRGGAYDQHVREGGARGLGAREEHVAPLDERRVELGAEGWVELKGAARRVDVEEAARGAEATVHVGEGRAVTRHVQAGVERRSEALTRDAPQPAQAVEDRRRHSALEAAAVERLVAQQHRKQREAEAPLARLARRRLASATAAAATAAAAAAAATITAAAVMESAQRLQPTLAQLQRHPRMDDVDQPRLGRMRPQLHGGGGGGLGGGGTPAQRVQPLGELRGYLLPLSVQPLHQRRRVAGREAVVDELGDEDGSELAQPRLAQHVHRQQRVEGRRRP